MPIDKNRSPAPSGAGRWSPVPLSAAALSTIVAALSVGCSGRPARVDQPVYNPQAGADAVAAYDTDGDGAIGGDELDRVPGLRASLGQVDTDGDGRLTAAEIDTRVQEWQRTRIAEMPVRCEVMLDGQPLPGAQVVLEPEPFLGPNVHPARGATAPSGVGGVTLADEHLSDPKYAGVACGWYKIRVTSSDRDIPPRYNTETTLGCEVAMNAHWVHHGAVLLELKSS